MQSLKTVQSLSNLGRILSKIVFVFCVVGFCGCVLGIVSLALGVDKVELGGVTLRGILKKEADVSVGTMYAAMAVGTVFCLGEAILAKFAVHYFTRELRDGTPFTAEGAKELTRLGVLAICIPIATQIAAQIVQKAFEMLMSGVKTMEIGAYSSVSLGVMMLVTAAICRYGAELTEGKQGGTS